MHVRELTLDLDPWSIFRALASKERPFFIDAGRPWGEEWVSSMGFRPRMQFRVTAMDPADAPFARLDTVLADLGGAASARTADRRPVPFASGVVLAIAYEARHALERGTPVPGEAADAPRLVGAVYDAVVSFDHRTRRWRLASWHLDAPALAAAAEEIHDAIADAARGARPTTLPMQPASVATDVDAAAYAARVARIHEYIAAGDVYQVNLTQRFVTRLPAPALDVYGRLRAAQPVPFAAYLDLGVERVLSNSPELFLRRRGGRVDDAADQGHAPARRDPRRRRRARGRARTRPRRSAPST